MEIRGYAEIIWRRKWAIILTAFLATGIVAAGSYWMVPVYSASAMVRVADGREGAASYAGLAYSERLMATYVHLLRSRPSLEQAILRLGIDIDPRLLGDATEVKPLPNTELLRISAESTDPALAMQIANALADVLVEQQQKAYFGQGKSTSEILQEQLASVEDKLRADRALLASLTGLQEMEPVADRDLASLSGNLSATIRFQEQTYALLLDRYDRARLEEASRANSISIVAPATLPELPVRPQPRLYLVLGLVLGLVGGVGIAFLLENVDRTIHSPDDLEAAAGTALLGWIPAFRGRRGMGETGALLDLGETSPATEAFRMLGVSTMSALSKLTAEKQGRADTLLVTSAEPEAGKSTVTSNLAAALARTGRRVVVVDADLKRPRQHRIFGMPNDVGLSDVLLNGNRIHTALRPTMIPGISLLSSGSLAAHSVGPLNPHSLGQVIAHLAERADVILLDGPPLLASADALALAPVARGVLVIAARNQSTRRRVQIALKRMERVGGRTIGVVFNKEKGGDGDFRYYAK